MEINLSDDTIKVVIGSLNNSERATIDKIHNLETNFARTSRVIDEIDVLEKYLRRIREAIITFEETEVCI